VSLQNNRLRKPVVFGRKKAATKSNDDDQSDNTLDMLLHYAKAGMAHAEQSLQETPDLFSPEERQIFEQNKNMLEQAPYLIDNYKSKLSEYDALHKKMVGILRKCEEIVTAGDDQAKSEIKGVLKEARVFSYDENGDLVMKSDASSNAPN